MNTRGGGSFIVDCVRPTTLVRRKHGGHSISIPNEDFKNNTFPIIC